MGNDVVGLLHSRSDGQQPKLLKDMGIISKMKFIKGDVTDLTSILSAIQYAEPDWIFHLAAQSHVPTSFKDPLSTFRINCLGTQNILEGTRFKKSDSRIVYAGSSEEYGLQFVDANHYESMKQKYGIIEPMPTKFPEMPLDEQSNLRPMSPYATSKVYGDYASRNYHYTFGMDTIISRAFNHEGAGRGHNFVTSTIVRQLVAMHLELENVMRMGDIQTFRDWSHVEDMINGYVKLAENADAGSIYVQGSMRTNSVLSYILYTISELGYDIEGVYSINDGNKNVKGPLEKVNSEFGGIRIDSNVVDQMFLSHTLEFNLADEGLIIKTNKRDFKVVFDPSRFRPSDVPILLSNANKLQQIGFSAKKDLRDIINDQINYYLNPSNRDLIMDV
jgi:GDPmannose 4,6-dehydratase